MQSKIKWLTGSVVLLLLLSACQTDYTEEALQKARTYTLEHTNTLPELQRNYVRYTLPQIQTANIFAHRGMRLTEYAHIPRYLDHHPLRNPQRDWVVLNFVWTPPDSKYSIIALGVGERNKNHWEPIRVILKKVVPERSEYEGARLVGSQYVMNNMRYLSDAERNRCRFSDAEVRETSFDLSFLEKETDTGRPDSWKHYLDRIKKKAERKQYSLIWFADNADKRIVIAGYGTDDGFYGWKPAAGMRILASQLDDYTIQIEQPLPDISPGENKK